MRKIRAAQHRAAGKPRRHWISRVDYSVRALAELRPKRLRACPARTRLRIIAGLGSVAQSVEQRIENPRVGGSIPPRATSKIKGLQKCKLFCF